MQTSSTESIDLDIQGVSKRYQLNGQTFTAVDSLSLQIPKGQFCSILGPSGCGKTTLLRMVAGFIEPDEGEILVGGKSMRSVPPNQRPVNMVFQHLALFPMMSVGENVGYGLARRQLKKAEIQHKVQDMLRRVGLPGIEDKRIEQLSGGQKQRVAIARSLVLEPTLLLLDEPLGALDLKLREHMKVELKQLQAQIGTTFLYITHDQSEALVMSDMVAVMNHGKCEQIGTPQDLYYRPQTSFVAGFVGNANKLSGRALPGMTNLISAEIADNLSLYCGSQHAFRNGQELSLYIRPESIAISQQALPSEAYANHLRGNVNSILFDGANSSVLVNLDNSALSLQVSLPQNGQLKDLQAGDAVHLAISAEHVQAFSA
ncbi:ABC transporter ATP-binding protein [Undibacterium jejuense]|uniref:ABC transporter ATP-binding protein n=1 Tax=Undibacterium jejuense TaxID=1344949 RepID=A0A923KQ50_9BURK|nr:ABC transporter ATP-binding protein [Undibacterium jejuense]MBC3863518.1 ABC transporter ATP-binding protein [Undibacterium jejuense]